MSHTFTRQELYDLVWSEPVRKLARRFGLSDVGLAKACKKKDIPRPPLGYWAKWTAGKRTFRSPLPRRGPGMADQVEIGGSHYLYGSRQTDDEVLAMTPKPPEFEDPIEDVIARAETMVSRVTAPKTMDKAHRLIGALLQEDNERREKQQAAARTSSYFFSWDKPLFDEPIEQRRLRILNEIFIALERCSMPPTLRGREARELSVKVGDQHVSFTLDATSQKPGPYESPTIRTRGASTKLRLCIGRDCNGETSWEDKDGCRLERQLHDMVVGLIVAGERQYRAGQHRYYEWIIERQKEIIEERRRQKEGEERLERERLIRLEKARVKRLLRDAKAMRQAADIRAYIEAVRARCSQDENQVLEDTLQAWASWARAQADRIDPVRTNRFLESMKDRAPVQQLDGDEHR